MEKANIFRITLAALAIAALAWQVRPRTELIKTSKEINGNDYSVTTTVPSGIFNNKPSVTEYKMHIFCDTEKNITDYQRKVVKDALSAHDLTKDPNDLETISAHVTNPNVDLSQVAHSLRPRGNEYIQLRQAGMMTPIKYRLSYDILLGRAINVDHEQVVDLVEYIAKNICGCTTESNK